MRIDKKRRSKKQYYLFFIGGLLIFLFYVWECAEVVTLSYRLNEMKRKLISLENKNRNLKANLHNYTNLANVSNIAREERKMVFPQNDNIYFLKVNVKESRASANKGFLIAREDMKGAAKKSHY